MPAAQEIFFGRTERTGEDSRSEFPYCATVAVGEGAEPTLSTGIVGYYTLTLNNVNKVRAAQFDAIGEEPMMLNEAVKCNTPFAPTVIIGDHDPENWDIDEAALAAAPQIQVPGETDVMQIYYYIADARYWDEIGNEFYKEGWADGSGMLAEYTEVPCGVGIWLRGYKDGKNKVEDTIFTLAGQVLGDDSGTLEGTTMNKVRAMPYPRAQFINDPKCDWSSLTPKKSLIGEPDPDNWNIDEESLASAPQIQVMSEGVFQIYYYVSDARYWDENQDYAEFYTTGWADGSGMLLTPDNNSAYVQVGEGVWFNAKAKNISCPISK